MQATRIRSRRRAGAAALVVGAAATAVLVGGLVPSASAAVDQETIPENADCQDLGFPNEFKIEADGEFPAEGTYADGDEGTESKGDTEGFEVEITYTDDDPLTFDFESTIAVNVVLVKAGTGALAYEFDPASTTGSGLESPKDDSISHITFCWGDENPPGSTTTTTKPGETTTTTKPGETTTTTGGPGGSTTTVPGGKPLPTPPAATPIEDEPPFTG